jgi:hypothetical protein
MKTSRILLALITATLLSNCATAGAGMGGMRMGQRSAAINDQRSRPEALTSSAQLSQNRRQRSNELEEARTQTELRRHDRDAMLSPLHGVGEGLRALGGIKSGINFLRY